MVEIELGAMFSYDIRMIISNPLIGLKIENRIDIGYENNGLAVRMGCRH